MLRFSPGAVEPLDAAPAIARPRRPEGILRLRIVPVKVAREWLAELAQRKKHRVFAGTIEENGRRVPTDRRGILRPTLSLTQQETQVHETFDGAGVKRHAERKA